jgi:hypothetical protein
MAVAMLLEWPGQSQEQYEQLMKLVALEANPPDGGLFHVAGPMPGGWRVVDIWESEEAFERFASERLSPAVEQVGIPGMPPSVLSRTRRLGGRLGREPPFNDRLT